MDQVMGAVMAVKGPEVMQIAGRGVPLPRALMLAQAPAMRAAWVGAFSALAAQTDVYIAAGTIPLPHEGSDSNEVYNTFFLFGPDGEIVGTADKVNLIPLEREEGLNLTPGKFDDLAPWVTPIGVFAPIVCADAWDADLVAGLVEEGAQLLLCPSSTDWTGFTRAWRSLECPASSVLAWGSWVGSHSRA
jgi:predicted amidohydrolase